MFPVERRHVTDKPDLPAVEFAFEGGDHLSLLGLVADEAHLDEFVCFEGPVDSCEHGGRQPGLADLNDWFEMVSEAAQVAALVSVELHAVDSIAPKARLQVPASAI